jgi:hypothetical protein
LKIKDGVCWISLGKKVLFRLHVGDSSANACARKVGDWIECQVTCHRVYDGTSFEVVRKRVADCNGRIKGQEAMLQRLRTVHSAQPSGQRRSRIATLA